MPSARLALFSARGQECSPRAPGYGGRLAPLLHARAGGAVCSRTSPEAEPATSVIGRSPAPQRARAPASSGSNLCLSSPPLLSASPLRLSSPRLLSAGRNGCRKPLSAGLRRFSAGLRRFSCAPCVDDAENMDTRGFVFALVYVPRSDDLWEKERSFRCSVG